MKGPQKKSKLVTILVMFGLIFSMLPYTTAYGQNPSGTNIADASAKATPGPGGGSKAYIPLIIARAISSPAENPTQPTEPNPTTVPTNEPGRTPTAEPTRNPGSYPTSQPTSRPTATPTKNPTAVPTSTSVPTTPPPSSNPMPNGVPGSWKLIFDDEFNGSSLDSSKWITGFPWGQTSTTTPLLYYRPENVVVSNGTVKLIAKKEAYQGKSYTSGIITTSGKFTHQYGFMEARLKVPAGQGMWPAFWNLPPGGKWPPEIDMMEILGHDTTNVELHYHYGSGSDFGGHYRGPDFAAGFHTFAVDWEPDAITWYVDGVQRNKFTNTSSISAEKMYLIFNLQVGGSWPGNPDSSTPFPSQYEIDYVRVWQK